MLAPAFCISLLKRPERLAAFNAHADETGLSRLFDLDPFPAFDGSQLVLDHELRSRIAPWNLEHMTEGRLRGNLGCTLSHLEIWRRIANMNERLVAVFEDDARAIAPAVFVRQAVMNAPKDADFIWLNDYNYGLRCGLRFRLRRRLGSFAPPVRRVRFGLMPDVLTTTEAYLISPSFASKIEPAIRANLGAIDRHVQIYVKNNGTRAYQVEPPLFSQADRSQSDTTG
jgi:hypothetical protein